MRKFVISLNSTPERLSRFRAINSHISVEHFEAVHGIHLNEDEIIKNGLKNHDCRYSKPAMGCAFSHIKLWDMCIKINKPITVFEDDAIIHHSFEKHSEAAVNDHKLEFILWGWNFDAPILIRYNEFFKNTIIKWAENDFEKNSILYQKMQFEIRHERLISAFGTVAYTITPIIAKKLLNLTLPLRSRLSPIPELCNLQNTGIDISMSFDYEKIGAKVSIPPLVVTPNNKKTSTINAGD